MPTTGVAVYTGSFDPFHLGHEDIVRRAARIFPQLIVGVGINPEKPSMFAPTERVAMIREVLADLAGVEVIGFEGLTVRFARSRQARLLVRGIRALSDVDYEFTMSLTNSSLDADIETVFLMAHKEYTHLSSTLIRQIACHGGDLRDFVPLAVMQRLRARFAPAGPTP